MASRRTASVPEPKTGRDIKFEDLKGTELFHDAPEEIIREIKRSSRICTLEPNQRLYTSRKKKSGPGSWDFIYIILSGYVTIWIPSCFDPTDEVFLAWRGPQQILGESRQPGAEQSKTRITTCEQCEFIEITLIAFLRFAAKDSSLYRNVANLLMRKMMNEGHRAEVLQMTNVTRKVAQTLIHLAEDRCDHFSKSDTELEIPGVMRHADIAAYAGIRRETVTTELNDLRDQELIDYFGARGSQIKICDMVELRKIVESKLSTGKDQATSEQLTT